MPVTIITPPAAPPVTLDRVKKYLRVSGAAFDDVVEDALLEAVAEAQTFMESSIVTQTLRLELNSFPLTNIYLPFGPVQSVSSVQYMPVDMSGYVTVPASVYNVILSSDELALRENQSWPGTPAPVFGSVRIDYVAGRAVENVPKDVIQAVKMLSQVNFDRDSNTADTMRAAARVLLTPHRRGLGV